MSLKYLIIGFFLLLGCKSTDLKMASKFKLIDESINLKVFIGEKILVNEFDPNKNNEKKVIDSITGDTIIRKTYVMDRGFLAKYKVVQNVFNDLKTDTIEFLVYDHYGRPEFENYENVLLYISLK
ncbi:hypothetical protein [Tenacibaculum ovolyticum]|uniref:hypothetical protein n=1 Tax=Tenacibaculum ovolyticum TaxID=104270 RepID=UPI0007EDCA41|nr:hypothetical protein [Tenacibaculum ovolyticum]